MTPDAEKKLILVVDDEPDERSYLTTLFEDNGYATASANDGNEALALVKGNKPDLITLDISMPEKSGIKFYRELKEDAELSNIPVVVVTGVTGMGRNPEDFERFLASRKSIPVPDGFQPKPVEREELLGKVSQLLGS
jgi:CheY-like chemotaxis protein